MPPRDETSTLLIDPIESITRRRLLTALLMLGLMAAGVGCGDDDDGGDPTAEPTNPGGETKLITTSYGTYEIPLHPGKVIAMENRRDLEAAVALKLPLVAVGIWGGATDPADVAAPFVPVDLSDVTILNLAEPDIEQVLVLEPDLIVVREMYLGDKYFDGRLQTVAPVIPSANSGPWRAALERVAAWLDRADELATVFGEYDALRNDVKQRHAEALESARVAIVEWYAPDAVFYAGGLDGFQLQANTLAELGGQVIEYQASRDYFEDTFSLEHTGELAAADAILLVGPAGEDTLSDLRGMDLWQQLPAEQAGRVVTTDTRTNQGSIYAAMASLRLLDELYTTITSPSAVRRTAQETERIR